MNAITHSRSGYARPDATLRPMRTIEYDVLAQVTRELAVSWPRRKENFPALVAALTRNLEFWTALAADVASPNNELPAHLRAQIFYLYEFTAHQSQILMRKEGNIESLIDINSAVMRGLRGQGGAP